MRYTTLLSALCASLAVAAQVPLSNTVNIYVQSLDSLIASPLVEINYDPRTLEAKISSYDAPEAPNEPELFRIGLYDSRVKEWTSSTTVTSSESFAKGYAPVFILSLDSNAEFLSVACQSGKIDAGQTRDFGPKVRIVGITPGKNPELNKPVVLKEGKVEEVVEKTLFQKYWWVGAALLVLMLAGGGGDGK